MKNEQEKLAAHHLQYRRTSLDLRYLAFEVLNGMLLRPEQASFLEGVLCACQERRSVCKQMIMGAGKKSSCVGSS